MESATKETCECGNEAVPYTHWAAMTLRLDDGVDRCMPCQRARRVYAFRMLVIMISVAIAILGALSGDMAGVFVLVMGPLGWGISGPYLRSVESERGPRARK